MREGKIYFNYSSFKFARTSLRSKAVADNGSGLNAVIKKDLKNETSITAQIVNRITKPHYRHNGFFNYCRLSPCYVSVFFINFLCGGFFLCVLKNHLIIN